MHKSKPTSAPSLLDTEPTHEAPGMLLRLDTEGYRQPKKMVKPKPKRRFPWKVGLGLVVILEMFGYVQQDLELSKKPMPNTQPVTTEIKKVPPHLLAEPLPVQTAAIINEPSIPADPVLTKDIPISHPTILVSASPDMGLAKTRSPVKTKVHAVDANPIPDKLDQNGLEPIPFARPTSQEADVGLVGAILSNPENTIGTEPSLLADLLASAKRAVVPKKIAQLVNLPEQEDFSLPSPSHNQPRPSSSPTQ